MLMSFLDSIGNVMAGSGLSELMTTIHAEHTVRHMLLGKQYSRAICAHLLIQSSLMSQILCRIVQPQDEDGREFENDNMHLSTADLRDWKSEVTKHDEDIVLDDKELCV